MDLPLAGVDFPLAGVDILLAGVDFQLAGVDILLAGVDVLLAGVDVLFAGVDVLLTGVDVLLAGASILPLEITYILNNYPLSPAGTNSPRGTGRSADGHPGKAWKNLLGVPDWAGTLRAALVHVFERRAVPGTRGLDHENCPPLSFPVRAAITVGHG